MTRRGNGSALAQRTVRPREADGKSAGARERLSFLEFMLRTDDLGACAQRCVEWLVAHTEARQAVCSTVDEAGKRLVGIAGEGMPFSRVTDFSVDLEDQEHPLVKCLRMARPAYLPADDRRSGAPLEGAACHVIPLRGPGQQGTQALALLQVATRDRRLDRDILWAADLFGSRIGKLHARGKAHERWLGQERTLLYTLINSVTDPILLTSPEGKLLMANLRAENLFEAPEEASEGRRRAVALNNMLFSSALTSRTIDQLATASREVTLVDPFDGSDLLYELLSTAVRDPQEGTRVVSILRNVSDLGRAMAEIQENYQKLRLVEADVRAERTRLDLIIDSVADPIVVTDPAGEIVLMNPPADRLFSSRAGGSPEVLRRVRGNDAHFSSFVANLLFSGADSKLGGGIGLVDPQDGRPMPVEAVAGKILGEKGELTAVVTILHDRTEALEKERLYEKLKKASGELEEKVRAATAELAQQNELLRRQALELEQASALKSQFLANMSHEFRTPLNAILGYTNMLLQGVWGETPPAQKKSLTRIDSNSRHLLSIINEILDITRIESGRMPLNLGEFEIPALVSEVMSELEPMIARSRLQVRTRLSPRLPAVRSDRQKVKQIVLNLLSNALKFTHQGSITITAAYRASRKELSIAVADTGIGISPEDQEKVFEDFRQLDNSPARGHGGTGLGLSISRRLAGMLGGRIALSSRPGRGSVFTLYLPSRGGGNKMKAGGSS